MIRIMVVDDDETIVGLVKMILGDESKYKIFIYINPREALNEFQEKNPNLVITDFYMPEMTGLEMAKEMRKINSKIKVLFFSGVYSEIKEIIQSCKEDGFNYFLRKPFNLDPLKKLIEEISNE